MMDETIHTFEQCLEIAKQCKTDKGKTPKNHLMLGNGFSIALRPYIFSYKSLAGLASPRINNLFDKLGTKDFEHLMRILNNAWEKIKDDPDKNAIAVQIQRDIDELPKSLIEVISKLHPEKVWEVVGDHYEKCYKFLAYFESGNKYTFNYDLLLYWVFIRSPRDKKLNFNDGFGCASDSDKKNRILTWDISREKKQKIYYLHGAMHLFNNNGMIQKISWNGSSIKKQFSDRINSGEYPIFISEGTKEHKLSRIQDSIYLKHAFDSLDKIDDNLFIFGHSLGDEDDHVFSRVNSLPELKNIFISIYGNVDSIDNQRIIDKVRGSEIQNPTKNYYFYSAKSADVWGSQTTPHTSEQRKALYPSPKTRIKAPDKGVTK